MKSSANRSRFIAILFAFVIPSTAMASPLFETLGDLQSPAGLNARFARGTGSGAAYFNPAMLSAQPDSLNFGFTVFQQSMNFTYFARPDGIDVTDDIAFNSPRVGEGGPPWLQQTVPTGYLQGTSDTSNIDARPRGGENGTGDVIRMATVGLTINVVPEYLVAGLYAYIPLGTYTEAQSWFSDERDQFFTNSLHATLYEDRMRAPTLALGLGSQIIDELRIGLAFTLALKAIAGAAAYAPDATAFEDTIQLAADVGVIAKVAPHFSIVYEPIDPLSISLTVHSPAKFEIETQFSAAFAIGGINEDSANRTSVHDYNPWIIGLGADYRISLKDERFIDVAAGVTYELWSNYIDRQGRTPAGPFEWSDIFVPTISATFEDNDFTVGVSGVYKPSPAPEQTGRTNYVDNDRIGGTVTGTYRTELATILLEIGLQFGAHKLLEREHNKIVPVRGGFPAATLEVLVQDELPDNLTGLANEDIEGLQTNNPGYPGYSSEGALWNAGLFLKIRY